MSSDLPSEIAAMFGRLWPMTSPIVVHLLPRDAWIVLGVIQFASRNPNISESHRTVMEHFGRAIQNRLAEIEPAGAPYMEQGWHPEFDVPIEK